MNPKVLIVIAVACGTYTGGLQAAAVQSSASPPSEPHRALLDKYCESCHNAEDWAGGIAYDLLDLNQVPEEAATWEKVVRKLRDESMPPVGKPRPDNAAYQSFATYLETKLDDAAEIHPNPGRTAAYHRLNREEYTNAVRDLLALEIDGKALFPPDDAGAGFDNDGQILSTSPLLIDRYLFASRQISRLAIGDPSIAPVTTTYKSPKESLQEDRTGEDFLFGSRGGIAIRYTLPLDGEYSIKIRLQKTSGIEGPRIMGLANPHLLDVRVDGNRVKLFTVGGDKHRRPDEVEAGLSARFLAKAGLRTITVAFMDEALSPEDILRPPVAKMRIYGWGRKSDSLRNPGVEGVSLSGPYKATGPGDTASRRRIFVCYPKGVHEETPCATKILSALAHRAYRRPVTQADLAILLGFYAAARNKTGGTFESGVESALQALLVSPDFLFRAERDPANVVPGTTYRVSDLELASRLSFFLWSSIPDDQLLSLAEQGRLKDPDVLAQQVRRMLADPRSQSLVENFFGQWLGLRNLQSLLPDTIELPDFDDDLRVAFEQEMRLFLTRMLREDRSVLELLNANYTYVNDRLARHYGIPNVYGGRFRRVTLVDQNRWGLLGKGAVLTVTSQPNRTSPVLRGQWVLNNIMGSPPPPKPANVPPFPDDEGLGQQHLTVRQRLEQHRVNPACAGCHSRMDPLGFALENFDAIGEWRSAELTPVLGPPEVPIIQTPIDDAGTLPNGPNFHGPVELRKILMSKPDRFARVVTEKLLTYALGRGIEYYDEPAVRRILRQSAPEQYRWSAIILGIVNSVPFQMRSSATPLRQSVPSFVPISDRRPLH